MLVIFDTLNEIKEFIVLHDLVDCFVKMQKYQNMYLLFKDQYKQIQNGYISQIQLRISTMFNIIN